jgi:hypothetical protein
MDELKYNQKDLIIDKNLIEIGSKYDPFDGLSNKDRNEIIDSDIKNNTWEYLNSLNEWIVDVNYQQIIYSIRTIVCSAFTERSLYWANIKTDPKYQDTEVISNKLLIISSKLKDNKYISMLIKECKQFFII